MECVGKFRCQEFYDIFIGRTSHIDIIILTICNLEDNYNIESQGVKLLKISSKLFFF